MNWCLRLCVIYAPVLASGVSISPRWALQQEGQTRVTRGQKSKKQLAKTEKGGPDNYGFLGDGYCPNGYYAGWVKEDAKSVSTCAQKCDSEPDCKYFSFKEGLTCSRHNATSCANPMTCSGADGYLSFKKISLNDPGHPDFPHPDNYEYQGQGYCDEFYAAWDEKDAVSLDTCARKCDSEPECEYFSLKEKFTCSRHNATSCVRVLGTPQSDAYMTYKKRKEAAGDNEPEESGMFDYELVGHGSCPNGYYAGGVKEIANFKTCATKCDSEPDCKYFSLRQGFTCSRYNAKVCTNREIDTAESAEHVSYKKVAKPGAAVHNYEYLGHGHCIQGYYAGCVKEDSMSVDACARKCDTEPQCKHFSLDEGSTCSRYAAADCADREIGNPAAAAHMSYKKIENLPSAAPTEAPATVEHQEVIGVDGAPVPAAAQLEAGDPAVAMTTQQPLLVRPKRPDAPCCPKTGDKMTDLGPIPGGILPGMEYNLDQLTLARARQHIQYGQGRLKEADDINGATATKLQQLVNAIGTEAESYAKALASGSLPPAPLQPPADVLWATMPPLPVPTLEQHWAFVPPAQAGIFPAR